MKPVPARDAVLDELLDGRFDQANSAVVAVLFPVIHQFFDASKKSNIPGVGFDMKLGAFVENHFGFKTVKEKRHGLTVEYI